MTERRHCGATTLELRLKVGRNVEAVDCGGAAVQEVGGDEADKNGYIKQKKL